VDHANECWRKSGVQAPEVSGFTGQTRKRGISVIATIKRHTARETLIKHEAKGINVSATIEWATTNLFGGQVFSCAHHDVFVGQVLAGFTHHFGDAEVSKHYAPIWRDQDVPGFYIAVDETTLVRVIQSGSNCCTNVNGEFG
jgi:hypothetical protein